MNQASDFGEYRALILRCKRPELDKLIKLTNLPRGGLKQDLQLRLLSYLEQDPSHTFISALNDLLFRQKHNLIHLVGNQLNGKMASNTTCGEGVWSQNCRDWGPLSNNSVVDDMRSSSSASCLPSQQTTFGSQPLWSGMEAVGASGNAQSTRVESLPTSSHQSSSSVFVATPQDHITGAAGNIAASASELVSAKNLTYQLLPGPIGPLIGLAGAKGSFRLPACLSGFRFRESPFFKEIDVLLLPQIMTPNHIGFATGRRSYDRSLALRFTPDQAETITYHCRRLPDERMEFGVQVIMRFARLDPATCAQLVEAHGLSNTRGSRADPVIQPKLLTLSEDSLPVHLSIQVNGRSVQLPPLLPSNRPGMDGRRNPRPINITQFLRVSPAISNYIKLTWTHDYASYVYSLVGVYLMHKRSPQQLCAILQSTAFQSAETMKTELIRKLQTGRSKSEKTQKPQHVGADDDVDDDDDLVMPNTLPVQLLCPLSKCRIDVPVRGRDCRHIQCYDATTYLIINERKPAWNCPVCDRKVYYEDLIIDGLFLEVLNSKTAQDLDEAVFHDDGTWSVLDESARPKQASSTDSNSDDMTTVAVERDYSTATQQAGCLNSPPGVGNTTGVAVQQRTPNSSASGPEPDSVGSSSMSAGLSFGAVSPAGSGSSGPPFNLVPPGSPIRGSAGLTTGSMPFRTPHASPHPVGLDKDPDRSTSAQNITIDLTASDDEADKSQRPGVTGNRSGSTTIVLSDDDPNSRNSPALRSPPVSCAGLRTSVPRPPPLFGSNSVPTPPTSRPAAVSTHSCNLPQNRPVASPQHPSPSSRMGSPSFSIASASNRTSQSLLPSQWLSKQSSCSTAETSSTVAAVGTTNTNTTVNTAAETISAQSRKRVSELVCQGQTNDDFSRPLGHKHVKSNGAVDNTYPEDPVIDSQSHSSRTTCPAYIEPAPSTPLAPYATAPANSTAEYPDFGNPYESINHSSGSNVGGGGAGSGVGGGNASRPYLPDPYHYYRNPTTAPNTRCSDGYSFPGAPYNANPYSYRSRPNPGAPSHCSPFDTTHFRRFRNGSSLQPSSSSSLDRQSRRTFETNTVRPDPTTQLPTSSYPTADDIYARFLSDPAFQHSGSSARVPLSEHVSRKSDGLESHFLPRASSYRHRSHAHSQRDVGAAVYRYYHR